VLSKDGIPALKEWQDIVSTPGTQMSAKSVDRMQLNLEGVKNAPEAKVKTGFFGSNTPAEICRSFSFFRAFTGQQL